MIIGQRCVQKPLEPRSQQLIKVTQARVTMAGGASQYVHEPRRAEGVSQDRRESCLAISCSFSSAFPRSVTQMSRVEARDSADESGAPRRVADNGLTRMNCFRVFSLMTFRSSTINSHLDRLRLRPSRAHSLSIRSMSATTPSGGPLRVRSSKYPKVNADSSCVRID